jgi:methyl-accepting chemotaxis protein
VRRSHILAAALVAALALVAAGCGGGGGSTTTTTTSASATDWANGFCGAFATWDQSFKDATSQFTSLSSLSKDNFQKAADDIDAATQQLITSLKDLGAPDTESGQQVKDSIDSLSTTLQTQVDAIKKTIDQTSGITEIPGAAQDIVSSLDTMNTALSSTAKTIEGANVNGELTDALKSSPDCANLTK